MPSLAWTFLVMTIMSDVIIYYFAYFWYNEKKVELMKYNYRKAILTDIDEIMIAVEDARRLLKEEGNGQWQFGYPSRDDFINDINNKELYVVLTPDGEIASVCAITGYEEAYMHMYEGTWLTDYEYLVMHRVAVKEKYRGLGYGKALFEVFIEVGKSKGIKSLRIDTHKNNSLLIHLFDLYGFKYCGKAILPPNKDRVMYEKVIE